MMYCFNIVCLSLAIAGIFTGVSRAEIRSEQLSPSFSQLEDLRGKITLSLQLKVATIHVGDDAQILVSMENLTGDSLWISFDNAWTATQLKLLHNGVEIKPYAIACAPFQRRQHYPMVGEAMIAAHSRYRFDMDRNDGYAAASCWGYGKLPTGEYDLKLLPNVYARAIDGRSGLLHTYAAKVLLYSNTVHLSVIP